MRAPIPVVFFLLLLLALPMVAAERPVSPALFVPADTQTFTRETPAVAAGDGFLVVWAERAFGVYPGPLRMRTYEANGTPRQPAQLLLTSYGRNPRAIWTGRDYFVVYALPFSRFNPGYELLAVTAVRVRSDGTIVEGSELPLTTATSETRFSAPVWNGAGAAVVAYPNGQPRLIVFDQTGVVSNTLLAEEPGPLVVRNGEFVLLPPAVRGVAALNGDGSAMVAVDESDGALFGTTLDTADRPLERFTIAARGRGANSLAWDRNAWITAYTIPGRVCTARFTNSSNVTNDCFESAGPGDAFVTVGSSGPFLAWSRFAQQEIATTAGVASLVATRQDTPVATVDAGGLLTAWIEQGRVHLGGIASDGSARPERILEGETEQSTPKLVRANDRTLLVWSEAGRVRATLVDGSGHPIPPRLDLGEGLEPDAATDGANSLVAWHHTEGERTWIESVRVDANLNAGGVERFVVDVLPGVANNQFSAAVAWTGSNWLVMWAEIETTPPVRVERRIIVEPVDANGLRSRRRTTLQAAVLGSGRSNLPSVACRSGACFAAWYHTDGEWLEGAPLNPDGTLAAAPAKVVPRGNFGSFTRPVVLAKPDGTFALYLANDAVAIAHRDFVLYSRITDSRENFGGALRAFVRDVVSGRDRRAAGR